MIKVISHIALTDAQRKKIEVAWAKKHKGEELKFQYVIDPKIIGGVLIVDDDVYYDATVKNAMLQITDALKQQ